MVEDKFDQGLTHLKDLDNTHLIKTTPNQIRDLAPNDSERVPLTFTMVAPGRQCHYVTVTADNNATPVKLQACATGTQAALAVQISAERVRDVGEVATFNVTIRNTGSSPAENVVLRVQFDPAVEPVIENDVKRLDDGSVSVQLDRLAANERRVIPLHGRCRTQTLHARARATVTALGGAESVDETNLEIRQPNTAPPPGIPGGP
jgi:uncharacterized repeat protein (TIGR01451 family)